jgi:Rod binding domain-containing protein
MADLLSPSTINPTLLAPVQTTRLTGAPTTIGASTPADDARRARAKDAAQKFESQFLAQMVGQMFEGVKTDGPFGGGFGEEMFRSVMADAMADKMTKAGGIGLSDTIQREILKMQGLT